MPKVSFPQPTSLEAVSRLTPVEWQAITLVDPDTAARWMLHCAQLGHPDAQAILGQWLLDGHGVAPNPVEALAWFLKAARQGQPMGMNMAGRCFENGWGVEADAFIACNWYRQAAHKDLDAGMYNYANVLATGKGVLQDRAAAFGWYQRAADLGHAKSMTKLGHFFEDGRVVKKNQDIALAWFERGARGGDFRGKFNYAGMLAERGQRDEALHWLQQVPDTATANYMRKAGTQLLQSADTQFRAVGQRMLHLADNPTA